MTPYGTDGCTTVLLRETTDSSLMNQYKMLEAVRVRTWAAVCRKGLGSFGTLKAVLACSSNSLPAYRALTRSNVEDAFSILRRRPGPESGQRGQRDLSFHYARAPAAFCTQP